MAKFDVVIERTIVYSHVFEMEVPDEVLAENMFAHWDAAEKLASELEAFPDSTPDSVRDEVVDVSEIEE